MRPAIHDATARQDSGEPLSVIGQAGDRSDGPRRPAMSAEDEIAELADRPTHQLRLSWQQALYDEPADPVPSAGLPRLVRARSEVAAQLGQRIIWESKYSVACLVYGVVGFCG
jgi:hypothetical protein